MPAITLTAIPHQTQEGKPYQHLRITISNDDGIIEPDDLKGLALPTGIQFEQGVVLEGKAPIWLYAYLTHECHAATWVGCYDPRLKGAVIVESHQKGISAGQVLPLELPI